MAAFKLHWPTKPLTREIAAEMIFDASLEPGKTEMVTLDELITCLEMVTMSEIENDDATKEKNSESNRELKAAWRRPSGCHVTATEIRGMSLKHAHSDI